MRRNGMTLVELLGVMVVLAILASIGVGNLMSAQKRARLTAAMSAMDGYSAAFTNVCVGNPGIVGDRAKTWVNAATYSSEYGLKKVVAKMNELLEDELMMYWDGGMKCYKSTGKDPWGNNYILSEYPISPDGTVNYYDPTAGGQAFMGISVWCTGNNTALVDNSTVADNTYGMALAYTGGLVETKWQGFNDEESLTGWLVRFK